MQRLRDAQLKNRLILLLYSVKQTNKQQQQQQQQQQSVGRSVNSFSWLLCHGAVSDCYCMLLNCFRLVSCVMGLFHVVIVCYGTVSGWYRVSWGCFTMLPCAMRQAYWQERQLSAEQAAFVVVYLTSHFINSSSRRLFATRETSCFCPKFPCSKMEAIVTFIKRTRTYFVENLRWRNHTYAHGACEKKKNMLPQSSHSGKEKHLIF